MGIIHVDSEYIEILTLGCGIVANQNLANTGSQRDTYDTQTLLERGPEHTPSPSIRSSTINHFLRQTDPRLNPLSHYISTPSLRHLTHALHLLHIHLPARIHLTNPFHRPRPRLARPKLKRILPTREMALVWFAAIITSGELTFVCSRS